MNDMVKGGRLTPALVSPVATVIQIHAGKVAVEAGAIDTTRPGKAWAGIGVGPGIASVGRPVEEVSAIVGKATAAFVHARDVHVAFGKVTGDLDVADEGRAGGDLSRIGPSDTVVSGVADEQGAIIDSEVVPGNVHPPVEGRAGIIVHPARLAIVEGAVVNAIMDPAIRVPGSGGLVAADTLTAAATI